MAVIKRVVLDVLKAHQPNALAFASVIADLGYESQVKITVTEVDEKTESVVLVIQGPNIHFEAISELIVQMGASIHSIDEVEVEGRPEVDKAD